MHDRKNGRAPVHVKLRLASFLFLSPTHDLFAFAHQASGSLCGPTELTLWVSFFFFLLSPVALHKAVMHLSPLLLISVPCTNEFFLELAKTRH